MLQRTGADTISPRFPAREKRAAYCKALAEGIKQSLCALIALLRELKTERGGKSPQGSEWAGLRDFNIGD
jgi:hypothetical protein